MKILLVIAHPDDDAIFAGALQARLRSHTWEIVCITSSGDESRGRELLCWQRHLGTPAGRISFLGEADDPEDRRRGHCSIPLERVVGALGEFARRPRLVVTHNAHGEYDHPHHVLAHRAVTRALSGTPRLEFGYGSEGFDLALPSAGKWPHAVRCYASQRPVIAKFRDEQETFEWSGDAPPAIRRRIARAVRDGDAASV